MIGNFKKLEKETSTFDKKESPNTIQQNEICPETKSEGGLWQVPTII